MKTYSSPDLVEPTIGEKVKRFYDIASPYYFDIFGEHIHDGYYITGRESREEAQENLIRLLAEKAKIKKGSRVLDVGCGIGGSSIWLAKNLDALTTGITISPVQIEMANKLAQEKKANSSFLLMDAEEMDFPEPFDAIWVVAALTHFPNQAHFLKLTTQFLKKKGKLIIYDWTIDEDVFEAGKDKDIHPVLEGMVLSSLYSNNTYLKWLIEDGYRIVYAEDITSHTIKTWDIPISLMKDPAMWKIISRITRDAANEIFIFLKGRKAIKLAMQKGKVKSLAIVAEKVSS